MSEFYTVMYNGINIYEYKMTRNEKRLTEGLRKECLDICNNLNLPRARCFNGEPYMGRLLDTDEFQLKYKSDIGYFALFGERGIYRLIYSFPEKDKEMAKFKLLKGEFSRASYRYELNHRTRLEEIWKNTYAVEYDSRKAAFEYDIKQHMKVGSLLTEEVIDSCTHYMNVWFEAPHWKFNEKTLLFEELSETYTRKERID